MDSLSWTGHFISSESVRHPVSQNNADHSEGLTHTSTYIAKRAYHHYKNRYRHAHVYTAYVILAFAKFMEGTLRRAIIMIVYLYHWATQMNQFFKLELC